MSSGAAMPAVGADFVGAGMAAVTGAKSGVASGGETDAVSVGSAAALCADSRAARFTLISLIPALASPAPHVATHNYTVILSGSCFKYFGATHKSADCDRRSQLGGITRWDAAVRHCDTSSHPSEISQKQWRWETGLGKARSIQTKDLRFCRFFSFSLPA
jgi:hypothetical protein